MGKSPAVCRHRDKQRRPAPSARSESSYFPFNSVSPSFSSPPPPPPPSPFGIVLDSTWWCTLHCPLSISCSTLLSRHPFMSTSSTSSNHAIVPVQYTYRLRFTALQSHDSPLSAYSVEKAAEEALSRFSVVSVPSQCATTVAALLGADSSARIVRRGEGFDRERYFALAHVYVCEPQPAPEPVVVVGAVTMRKRAGDEAKEAGMKVVGDGQHTRKVVYSTVEDV